jgi:hypothetical protein
LKNATDQTIDVLTAPAACASTPREINFSL